MNTRIFRAAAALALCALLAPNIPASAQAGPSLQLPVTTAIIAAGGGAGAGSFSSIRALGHIIGSENLQTELRTLRDRYGSDNVDNFVQALDFSFIDGWQRAGQHDVKMPPPSSDSGIALALDIIRAGTGTDHVFRMSTMMDALWSPRVSSQIQADIAARYGSDTAGNFQRIGDQFFYDVAQALGKSELRSPVT
jgi:hypothetical protein